MAAESQARLKKARALAQAGQAVNAISAYRKFLDLQPTSLEGWGEYAELLRRAGRLVLAREACERALRIDPDATTVSNTLGQILIQEEDWPALRAEMERRVAHFTGAELLWELSNVTLMFGDLPLGWRQYEARWQLPGLIGPPRQFTQPRWKGESFVGKTLLLHWEQGQGDTLMFIRYAPLVKARGGRVLVETQASVAGVAGTCAGIDAVIPYGAPLPPFDLHLPLLSLPAIFETDLDSVPAEIPYLAVPAQVPNREAIARVLAPTQGLMRIGLVWAGSATNTYDAHRSVPATVLKALARVPGVVWHSFQPGWKGEPPFPNIVPLGPLLRDFSDTAYALSEMDLVVTVDTAVAHLAGALGIPTFLLVASLPDWRWMMGRDDSPWYPTLRIYRQVLHGDWQSVIQRVVSDLAEDSQVSSLASQRHKLFEEPKITLSEVTQCALTADPLERGIAQAANSDFGPGLESALANLSGPKLAWEQSAISLLKGDLVLGWAQYEARHQIPGLITPQRYFTHPRWDGKPFQGKTLLLHYEQGLGDTLMFVRYAPMVKALGGTVLLAAQAALADVVATCPGFDVVIPKGVPPPPFDVHLPLLSLPWVFKTELATIPAEVPYLGVPAMVPNRQQLESLLTAPEGFLRIGLAWKGSASHPRDAERSLPSSVLAPLSALSQVAWYSFQREEKLEAPFTGIHALGPYLSNFSDMAFALHAMDLVITADTAVAHLAGALGIPVFLLVTSLPDWRWMLEREDSPWYPTLRIYRQSSAGDWQGVIDRVVSDLMNPG